MTQELQHRGLVIWKLKGERRKGRVRTHARAAVRRAWCAAAGRPWGEAGRGAGPCPAVRGPSAPGGGAAAAPGPSIRRRVPAPGRGPGRAAGRGAGRGQAHAEARGPARPAPGSGHRRNPSGCCARSAADSLCRWPAPVLIAFRAKHKRKSAAMLRCGAHGEERSPVASGLPGRRMRRPPVSEWSARRTGSQCSRGATSRKLGVHRRVGRR